MADYRASYLRNKNETPARSHLCALMEKQSRDSHEISVSWMLIPPNPRISDYYRVIPHYHLDKTMQREPPSLRRHSESIYREAAELRKRRFFKLYLSPFSMNPPRNAERRIKRSKTELYDSLNKCRLRSHPRLAAGRPKGSGSTIGERSRARVLSRRGRVSIRGV